MARLVVVYFAPSKGGEDLLEDTLAREGIDAELIATRSSVEFSRALWREQLHLVILCHEAPGCWEAFQEARDRADLPKIVLAENASRETGLPYLRTGAEFLHWGELWRLGPLAQKLMYSSPQAESLLLGDEEEHQRIDSSVMESLGGTIRRLSMAGSLEKVAAIAAPALRKWLRADGAAFFWRRGRVCHCLAEDAEEPVWLGRKFPISQSIAAWSFRHKAGSIITDAERDQRIPSSLRGLGLGSLVMAPLVDGVLVAYWFEPERVGDDGLGLATTLANAAGSVIQAMITQGDLGRVVQERTRVLQSVNEELESFAYTISHDLKTPLSIIKTTTWTLRENLDLDERARKCVDRIEAASSRMHAQIEAMLAMYHLTRGELMPEQVDLGALAREVEETLRATDPTRIVEFRIEDDLRAYGDPALLRAVLENLLANAWKYTSKLPVATIEFGKQVREGKPVFFVRDNGVGFDKNSAARLFTVFQRLHNEAEFTGTGVGLASVKRIVNRHGGRVWAEGERNRGASFFFSLPEEGPRP